MHSLYASCLQVVGAPQMTSQQPLSTFPFTAALVEPGQSIPVHSLILTSHLFFCLPLLLFPSTVPCRIVFAKPEDLETWSNHLRVYFLIVVKSSSYSPMLLISVGRFRIFGGGQGLEYWGRGCKGGQIPSRHMTS